MELSLEDTSRSCRVSKSSLHRRTKYHSSVLATFQSTLQIHSSQTPLWGMYYYYHHFTDVQTGADRVWSINYPRSLIWKLEVRDSKPGGLVYKAGSNNFTETAFSPKKSWRHSWLSKKFLPVEVVCQSSPLLKRVFQDNLMQYSYEMNFHYTL